MSTAIKDHYRSHYDEQSPYWDGVYKSDEASLSIFAVHFRQRRDVILRMVSALPRPEGAGALDAGCGPGAYIAPLLDMGYAVSAFDQSPGMIERARGNFDPALAERVTLKVAAVDEIPFPDAAFDVVTNVAVLMYVPDEVRVIAELFRVVKPGGTLIITVDNKSDLADHIDLPMRLRRLLRRLRPAVRTVATGGQSATAPRTFSPREMRALLTGAGFVVDEETSVGYAPFYLNGRRIFSDRTDRSLDRRLGFLKRLPGLGLAGYTYICRCHRPTG